jgi:hypothetical protein
MSHSSNTRGLMVLLVCLGAISLVGWAAGSVTLENPSALLWILITMVLCCAAIAISAVRERDPLAPLVVIPVTFIILYVFRPLYILSSSRWGPTAAKEDRGVTPEVVSTMTHTSRLVCLGIATFIFGYLLQRSTNPLRRQQWSEVRGRVRRSVGPLSFKPGVAVVLLGVTLVLAIYAYGSLISEAGGLSAYISELSVRSGFFFGRSYLTTVAIPLKIVVLSVLAVVLLRTRIEPRLRITAIVLTLIVVSGDFLTGGRAAMLTGTLLPAVLLVHYLRRPLRLPALLGLVSVALLMFIVVRIVTRDAVYDGASGGGTIALIQDAVLNVPKTTVGGQDAIPYDSLMVLVEADAHGESLQWGDTYLPILTFPIPRSIWPGKPLGGANVWFTQKFFPTFFGKQKIETSISLIGESLANFGIAGVALIMFVFGFGLSALYRRFITRAGIIGSVAYAVTFGYAITLLRGDAFHSVTSLALTLALLWVTAMLCTGSPRLVTVRRGAREAVTQP